MATSQEYLRAIAKLTDPEYSGALTDAADRLDKLETDYREIVQLAVDAEIITRSRCKELIGMSHPEIGKLFVNSPIGKATAQICLDILHDHIWAKQGDAATARAAIKERFGIIE
jgi:hypothetical protein